MRSFLNDFLAQLKGIWGRLDGGQRFVVVSVLLATVAGIGGMVWFAGRPSYETVFTATGAEELAAAKRALEDASIPYVPDGMSFKVDRQKAAEAGLAIQSAGLGSGNSTGGIGASSIIDDADTRAWKLVLQSIARAESAVAGMSGIASARITASPPKRARAFVDRDRESRPSATVLLSLKPGASFADVRATAASLTGSQLGIPVENVTVANAQNGQRWTYDPDRDGGSGGTSDFHAMERVASAERTQKAQEVLDRMWPGKASVTVNVELDPSWEIVSEKVLPTTELVKSDKTTKEATDQQSGTGGSPGGASNGRAATSSSAGTEPSSTKNNTKNETRERQFVTEIGERRSGRQAPAIKRITVAVVYDKTLGQAADFDPKSLENAVKAMVGWDKDRDAAEGFSLLAGDFAPIDLTTVGATTGGGFAEIALQWGPTVGQVLGVVVVLLFLRGLFKRSKKGAPDGAAAEAAAPKADSPEEMQRKMRKEIERAIASDPAALAKLLETWLIDQSA